jgi:hypothetical protein
MTKGNITVSDRDAIVIRVPDRFSSRKAAIHWPAAGMTPEDHARWREALKGAVRPYETRLKEWVAARCHLEARMVILGPKRRLDPLDAHDALAQVLDELMAVVFPRPAGSRTPQWQDKLFWRVSAEKVVAEAGRVEIEIAPMRGTGSPSADAPRPGEHAGDEEARQAFHHDLLVSGLVRAIKKPAAHLKVERPLVQIQGKPLSQTIVEERR